jgi:RNA polymerase sigma-70 factor (ECF subfamily)
VSGHESALLGAYVLGVLDGPEWATVQAHLEGCAACRREVDDLREMEAALGEIPPEALLDGPPADGDRLLRTTLAEARGVRRRRSYFGVLAAIVVVVALVAAGLVAGRSTAPGSPVGADVAAPAVTGSATDPLTGVTMAVSLQPAAGWVRVRATLAGVPAGEDCRIFVVSAAGGRQQAASWLSAAGPTTVDGAALMAPADVAVVQAETYAGQILVAVPL